MYSYIKNMQKCSYVTSGEKKSKSGGTVKFIFNSDKDMQQI